MLMESFASGILVLFVDQCSKHLVRAYSASGNGSSGAAIRIRFVPNRHKRFTRRTAHAVLALTWAAALAGTIVLHQSGAWFQSAMAVLGLGIAFGEAAGNLVDILRHRYVIDFIDLHWWPVFNLADVAIIAGLAMAFVL